MNTDAGHRTQAVLLPSIARLPAHVRGQMDSMYVAQHASTHPQSVVIYVRGASSGRLVTTFVIDAVRPPRPQLARERARLDRLYPDNHFLYCHE
ncbi:hypothetical protein ACSFA0_22870 [Variovorax sp. LT1P1]|uniref:hypothetical protein n=1 Tax=Variovorax sp. LT1P1 TaxID=3443730 RepID=UPI003F48DFED